MGADRGEHVREAQGVSAAKPFAAPQPVGGLSLLSDEGARAKCREQAVCGIMSP